MGALHAKKEKCNDAIILNSQQRVCDSTIANIFIVKDEIIKTPSLSEGCIAGVMRNEMITSLKKESISVVETSISINELLIADEVFLTNSIYNIRWVAGIQNSNYTNLFTSKLVALLSKTNPSVFC